MAVKFNVFAYWCFTTMKMLHVVLKDQPLRTYHGILYVTVNERGKVLTRSNAGGSDSEKTHLCAVSSSSSGRFTPSFLSLMATGLSLVNWASWGSSARCSALGGFDNPHAIPILAPAISFSDDPSAILLRSPFNNSNCCTSLETRGRLSKLMIFAMPYH